MQEARQGRHHFTHDAELAEFGEAASARPLQLQPLDLIGQRDDARRQGVNGEGERVQLPSLGMADQDRLNSLVGLGRICGNCS